MLPLNRLISEGLRHYHLDKGVKAKQSVPLWERVAGPTVAAVTEAENIRDGVLIVHTRSSAWSQELALLREPLIARINQELGEEVVKDIRFKVRRIRKSAPKEEAEPAPDRDLSAEEREAIASLTSTLDPEMASHMSRVMEQQKRRSEAGRTCPGCGGPLHGSESLCPFCR